MRGNTVSHRQANFPQADANHVKVIPGIRGAGATISRNTESRHDGYQTDRQPVRPPNQNQLALGAAVEELSNWVEQRGSAEIANNVRGALETLDENLLFIRQGIAELIVSGSVGQS